MKKNLLLIFLFIYSTIAISQENTSEQKDQVIFFEKCTKKNIKVDYRLDTISKESYKITYWIARGNWNSNQRVISNDPIDSVTVAKILIFTNTSAPNKKAYLNCDTIADGIEKEYHANGTLQKEGQFKKGIPKWIKYYDDKGHLKYHSKYKSNSFFEKRRDYYDLNGELKSFQTFKRKRNKIILKKFDKNGFLILEETKDIEEQ